MEYSIIWVPLTGAQIQIDAEAAAWSRKKEKDTSVTASFRRQQRQSL